MLTTGVIIIMSLIFIFLIYNTLKNEKEVKKWRERHDKMLNLKKSSEIRVGKIGENMAPFLKDWPYNPNKFRFIGNPIDGIQINKDAIIIIEIKTGKAHLTKSQRKVRNLVKNGKVYFETFRIDENKCTLRREESIKLGDKKPQESWECEPVIFNKTSETSQIKTKFKSAIDTDIFAPTKYLKEDN